MTILWLTYFDDWFEFSFTTKSTIRIPILTFFYSLILVWPCYHVLQYMASLRVYRRHTYVPVTYILLFACVYIVHKDNTYKCYQTPMNARCIGSNILYTANTTSSCTCLQKQQQHHKYIKTNIVVSTFSTDADALHLLFQQNICMACFSVFSIAVIIAGTY